MKAPGEATVGDRTSCPVSGKDFTVSAESPHVEYQGKLYYFCCPQCPQKFLADPAKYLRKPGT
ncbi:MAG TPA: YHS domain-containing protein [Polyangiaceae bacterium]|nr:YHS domain-containing protein [Polyangiaceae bacterium]